MMRDRLPRAGRETTDKDVAGYVEHRDGKAYLRVRHEGQRPRIFLGANLTEAALARKRAETLGKLRRGELVFDAKGDLVDRSLGGSLSRVRDLATAWTSGALLERFGKVNGLRELTSAKIIACTLEKHAFKIKTRGSRNPAFGDLPVAAVTEEDCLQVMSRHKGSGQTRLHTYSRLHRLFDLAIFPCRMRKEGDNPVTRYLRPSADSAKQYLFLYPDEMLALLACKRVPLGRRVLYALAAYAGLRKSTLHRLEWRDVDFDHRTITRSRCKGSPGNIFAMDPSLYGVLQAWHEHCGKPAPGKPVVRDLGPDARHEQAQYLRDDLREAGVTRAVLFSDAPDVAALRFHDLRATFVTWARRAAKSDAWISERTGHLTKEMIDRYTRAAQTLADLGYDPFPDLTNAIPEFERKLDVPQPTASPIAHLREPFEGHQGGVIIENAEEWAQSLREDPLEVLAGKTVGVQVPSFAQLSGTPPETAGFRRLKRPVGLSVQDPPLVVGLECLARDARACNHRQDFGCVAPVDACAKRRVRLDHGPSPADDQPDVDHHTGRHCNPDVGQKSGNELVRCRRFDLRDRP
ncbi:MAG: tyrosine-type recombinase/integrase [Deltaproteobacteria bacterium]|nr:tyrosine-type recombinase/integrase [Deltaproteobacteria bacterium]